MLLDCKTRWNSILPMAERFLQLERYIAQLSPVMLSEREIEQLSEFCKALALVERATKALGKENLNLLEAEITIDWLINSLDKLPSEYAKNISICIHNRISERRTDNSDIICYLGCIDIKIGLESLNYYCKPSRQALKMKYFSIVGQEPLTNEPIAQSIQSDDLENLLQSIHKEPKIRADDLDAEIDLFEEQKIMGPKLTYLFERLKSIKPTSIESERVFSSCNQIVTKFRTSMKEDLLDAVICTKKFINSFKK